MNKGDRVTYSDFGAATHGGDKRTGTVRNIVGSDICVSWDGGNEEGWYALGTLRLLEPKSDQPAAKKSTMMLRFFSGITAEETRENLRKEQAQLANARPEQLAALVGSVHYRHGVIHAMELWEAHLANVEEFKPATEVDELLLHLSRLTELLLVNPGDTWSGRGNDARRSFNDGSRAVLEDIGLTLQGEIRKHLPGS